MRLPSVGRLVSLGVSIDGVATLDLAGGGLTLDGARARGSVDGLDAGRHEIEAHAVWRVLGFLSIPLHASTWLERVALDRPDACEILNQIECVLPFPSSRYLEPASTPTGVRVVYPAGVLPEVRGSLDPVAFGGQDGFSPAVQVLMHFPGGVDPALSGASRLLESTRTHDETSLQPSSPTLLLDASDGMKPVLHWIERDARAARGANPEREVLFLRPAVTLQAEHRYIVAMRRLRHADGTLVEAEPVFAALRDRRPSDIPAVEARRAGTEEIFAKLARRGVRRSELVLAFDFVVQSDQDLAGPLLAMRDRAFDWLALQHDPTFTVFPFAGPGDDSAGSFSIEHDCGDPNVRNWRELRGTFEVPLFLSLDPLLQPIRGSRLVDDDGDGLPDAHGTMQAPFAITIPCAALDPAAPPLRPIVTGHGLFGNGRQIVNVPQALGESELSQGRPDFLRISGATDWLGLSSHDFPSSSPFNNFIVTSVLLAPSSFGRLPDRLRQGVTNTLVLGRMLREARFNAHDAFRTPDGRGVLPGSGEPLDYFGISLGGVMGTLFAAVSPDVTRVALDVPAANFSILIQRSTAIGLIELVLNLLNRDPMAQAIFFGLAEELWDSAEPAGYLRHVTRNPLPGSGRAKDLLYTVAKYDGVVSNEASEIAIRTLGLPNLHDARTRSGSAVADQPGIRDVAGPLSARDRGFVGAAIHYDIGMYGDLSDPALLPFVPPLANATARSGCDPHGRSVRAAAEAQQIATWLDDGVIENSCDGLCDGLASAGGFAPLELPSGTTEPCDPLSVPNPSPF
jgi:hypothetical protein